MIKQDKDAITVITEVEDKQHEQNEEPKLLVYSKSNDDGETWDAKIYFHNPLNQSLILDNQLEVPKFVFREEELYLNAVVRYTDWHTATAEESGVRIYMDRQGTRHQYEYEVNSIGKVIVYDNPFLASDPNLFKLEIQQLSNTKCSMEVDILLNVYSWWYRLQNCFDSSEVCLYVSGPVLACLNTANTSNYIILETKYDDVEYVVRIDYQVKIQLNPGQIIRLYNTLPEINQDPVAKAVIQQWKTQIQSVLKDDIDLYNDLIAVILDFL